MSESAGSSWRSKLLLVVVGLIAFRVCSKSDDKAGQQSTAAAVAAVPAPAPVPVPTPAPAPSALDKLAAATLLQAYNANEVAADTKYKSRRFRVTGRVAAVKSDFMNEPQVWLGSELDPVIASGLSKEFAATLEKGDNLTAACTVQGSIVGTPTLDCSGPQ